MLRKINEVVSLKKFKPVIEIKGVQEKEKSKLFNDYIVTEDISENFQKIFEEMTGSISEERIEIGVDINPSEMNRAFLLRGAYGTGKSYFLLTLATILEEISKGNGDVIKEKFNEFDGLVYQIEKLMEEGKYFVISINGVSETNIDFEDAIMKNFIDKSKEYFPEDDFISDSTFERAINSLKEARNEPMKWKLISSELKNMNLDYEHLISGLKKYKRGALKEYEELMEKSYGIKVDLHDNEFDFFIKESSNYIKDKGYKGIVYLFDEFSAYLTSLIEDDRINKNLAKIQELAEACHISNNNETVFIASIHKSLPTLLKSAILEKEELEKVTGRFKPIEIDFSGGGELLKDTIKIEDSKYLLMKNEYDEIRELDNMTNGILKEYYPIHPNIIKYLNTLSKLYAQENRTLFMFMSDVVDKKIRLEEIIVDGKANVITLDYLYDYFIEDATEDNREIVKAANDVFSYCNEKWKKEIVKSLVVARMSVYDTRVGAETKIGLSVNDLSKYLLIEDEEKIENFLQDISSKPKVNIYYDEDKNMYEFVESAINKRDIEIDKNRIAREVKEKEYDELVKLLRSTGKNRRYYNRKINIEPLVGVTPVKREFGSQIFSNSNLINYLDSKKDLSLGKDCDLIHLLPRHFEKDSININEIKAYMKEYGSNIVIAVPKKYEFNREAIIDNAVYEIMLNDEKYLEDQKDRQYISKEKRKYENILRKEIENYTDIKNFYFVFNNGVREFETYDELFKYTLENHYDKFPRIKSPMRSERRITNQIIKTFIAPGHKIIGGKSNAEEDRHIKNTMVDLDLATTKRMPEGNEKVELKMPIKKNNEISAEIFDIVCNCEKDEMFNILEKEPYGMPEFLIELYIACAVSLGKIYINKGNTLLAVESGVLSNIKDNREVSFKRSADNLDYEALKYAKDLWQIIGKAISSNNYIDFDPEKRIRNKMRLQRDIYGDILVFLDKLKSNLNILEGRGFEFKPVKKLGFELESLNKVLEPEKYIKRMNELPNRVVGGSDKDKSLKEIEDMIEGFSNITKDLKKYLNILSSCNEIEENKFRFKNNKVLMKQYKCMDTLKKDFLKNPLYFNNIEKLEEEIRNFFSLFNELFKINHGKLYKKIDNIKDEINKRPEIELIEAFEKFQFTSISTLEDINKKIRRISCNNKFSDDLYFDLYNCDCLGKNANFDSFEEKYQDFMSEVEEAEKRLLGAIGEYRKEFLDLDRKNIENKKSLREFIKDKDINLFQTYINFMNKLHDDPVSNRKLIIEKSDELAEVIIEYQKYISTKEVIGKISFKALSKAINKGVILSGRAEMSKEEFLKIVEKALNEEVGDKTIIIN